MERVVLSGRCDSAPTGAALGGWRAAQRALRALGGDDDAASAAQPNLGRLVMSCRGKGALRAFLRR